MTMSLRGQRKNAFLQLDRITVRRRMLLARWLDTAEKHSRGADGNYHGMSREETDEVSRSLQDIRAFCATENCSVKNAPAR